MAQPYCWPVKPFDEQHPVRGFFNDPRISGDSRAFHFGVDVSAPDGTAVFAVEGGKVFIEDKGHAVAVQSATGRSFGFWHVHPAVAHHQIVERHQLLGHIEAGWGHVHFAESMRGRYLDPLRPGALRPFVDVGNPTVAAIAFERANKPLPTAAVNGLVNIVAQAYDTTPIHVPPPWSHMPVAPAVIRFRVLRDGRAAVPWRLGVDLRTFRDQAAFHVIYAPGTQQNHPGKPGCLRYTLAHDWNASAFDPGDYRIDVEARDVHGNRAVSGLGFTIRTLPPL